MSSWKGKHGQAILERLESKAEKRRAADQAVLDQLAKESAQTREKTERLRALRAAREGASAERAGSSAKPT
jgi:hypothetical protein